MIRGRPLACLVTCWSLLLLSGASVHASATDLQGLLSGLSRVQHIQAHFRDEKHSGILQFALVTEGDFEYRAPDFIARRTTAPKPGLFEVSGDQVRIEGDGRTRLIDIRDKPMPASLLRAVRAILAGDRAYLDTLFSLRMSGDKQRWRLQLQPRDDRLRQVIDWMEVGGHAGVIDRLSIHEANGDYTDTVFSAQRIR